MSNRFILIAEDDADDRFLLETAFNENGFSEKLFFVPDGVELMRFLNKPEQQPQPSFILLDLNMPKKDGREVLCEIKSDPILKNIPVVIFSTTNNEQEMKRCYQLGANSYITKPNSYHHLLEIIAQLHNYWINTPVTATATQL